MTLRIFTCLLCLLLSGGVARADERPSTGRLVAAGLAMAPPVYLLGVATHEGSHALTGKLFGAELVEFHVLPGRYGAGKNFHFGYTRVRGYLSPGEKTVFWLSPKIADAVIVGSYSLALALDAVPRNRYGRLTLAVLATGAWVDFSKDALAFWDSNDVVRAYNMNGLDTELSRLPLRLLHVSLSAAGAYALFRGYQGVFESAEPAPTPLLVPLVSSSF